MVGKQSTVFDVYETSSRFFKEVSIPSTNRSVNSIGYERFRKGQETVLLYFWPEMSWSSCWLTLFHLVLFHLVTPLVPRKVQLEKTRVGWLSNLIYVLSYHCPAWPHLYAERLLRVSLANVPFGWWTPQKRLREEHANHGHGYAGSYLYSPRRFFELNWIHMACHDLSTEYTWFPESVARSFWGHCVLCLRNE